MTTTKRGIALGFAAGLAVAIACSDPSITRSADAGPPDTTPTTEVPDRLRVRTADTDIDQLIEGTAPLDDAHRTAIVVEGPAVLTDVWSTVAEAFIYLSTDAQCEARVTRPHAELFKAPPPGHGLRLVVKAGEFLCLFDLEQRVVGTFAWGGYRPYPP